MKDVKNQEFSSKKTARNQLPAIHKVIKGHIKPGMRVLDIGCGIGDKLQNEVKKMGGVYYGYDPYNKSDEQNEEALRGEQFCCILISNVLNVVKEKAEREKIVKMALKYVVRDIFITCYRGELTAKERKEGIKTPMPISTRDGWQNRFPLSVYLEEIQEYCPRAFIGSTEGVRYIHIRN